MFEIFLIDFSLCDALYPGVGDLQYLEHFIYYPPFTALSECANKSTSELYETTTLASNLENQTSANMCRYSSTKGEGYNLSCYIVNSRITNTP